MPNGGNEGKFVARKLVAKKCPGGAAGALKGAGTQVSLTAYMPEPRGFKFEGALPADENHKGQLAQLWGRIESSGKIPVSKRKWLPRIFRMVPIGQKIVTHEPLE